MARFKTTLVKRFTYRLNAAEEFSNNYTFIGTAPVGSTAWRTHVDALILQEKTLYPSSVSVVRAYGYATDADDAVAIYSVDLTVSPDTPVAGTFANTGGRVQAGDSAVWVRWKTSRLNTRGKPIYLRKYWHPACTSTGGSQDDVLTSWITAANAFGTKMYDGSFTGGFTITAPGHDDTILSRQASSYVTTRTLKRRGKRPGA